MSENNNGLSKYRIEQLENRVKDIQEELTLIKDNHLHHLELSVVKLSTRVNLLTTTLILAIVTQIVVRVMFG